MKIWNKISGIGISEDTPPSEARRIQLINQCILLASSFTFAFVPVMFFAGMTYYIPFQLATGLLCAAGFIFNHKNFFTASVFLLVLALSFNLFYCNLCYRNTGVACFFFPLATIPLATIRNKKIVFFLFAWCVAGFFATTYLSSFFSPVGVISEPLLTITYCVVIIAAFMSMLLIIFNLRAANDRYEENIILQKKFVEDEKLKVEEKQKEILDSIRYAKRIQTALMTNEKFIEKNLSKLQERK